MKKLEILNLNTMPVNDNVAFGFGNIEYSRKNYISIPIIVDHNIIYNMLNSNIDLKHLNNYFNQICTDEEYYITTDYNEEIVALYSIKNHRFLDISNEKLINLYKYMFYSGKKFELAYILSLINENDLRIINEDEKNYLSNYLNSGNKNISRKEIVDYILKGFPNLEKYTNLKEGLSVLEYRNIAKDIGEMVIKLRAIRQDLDFIERDDELKKEFGNIYVPMEEQNQRVLQLKK